MPFCAMKFPASVSKSSHSRAVLNTCAKHSQCCRLSGEGASTVHKSHCCHLSRNPCWRSEQLQQIPRQARHHAAHRHRQRAQQHHSCAGHLHPEAFSGRPQQPAGAEESAQQASGPAAWVVEQVQNRRRGEAPAARWNPVPAVPHTTIVLCGSEAWCGMEQGRVLVWDVSVAEAALDFCHILLRILKDKSD